MSHGIQPVKNKQQKHPKVHMNQYLYNSGEPRDDFSHDSTAEPEDELLEDSFFMRQRNRRIAQSMRNNYS